MPLTALKDGVLNPSQIFDKLQLSAVLQVCQKSTTLSDAGRKLFAPSRRDKTNPNDADRLKKYLAKFGLNWDALKRLR